MEAIVKMLLFIAMTMALSITLTMNTMSHQEALEEKPPLLASDSIHHYKIWDDNDDLMPPSKRVSRFLAAAEKNPRAADHCHKDHEVCNYIAGGKNSTCCNNKCLDLSTDWHNCGACKKKCKYTEACCRGQCVYLSMDKRHCGECNNRCAPGEFCFYGMCGYA